MSGPVAMTADDHFARACAERDRADEWVKRADDLSKKLEAAEAARDEATRRLAVVEEAVRAVVSTRLIAASITADEMERAPCGVCGSFAPRFKKWIDDFDAVLRAALENPK